MSFKKKRPSVVYWLGNNLYLNITNRCPNNCYFCLRNFKNGIEGFNLKLPNDPSINEVIRELQAFINKKSWEEVVFCGFGEPLERLDCVLEVTRWVKKLFGKSVRIDTNGQGCLLNSGRNVVEELKEAGIDKISVSLNAHNRETYERVCKPKFENAFENVLKFIEKAKNKFDTEITTVTIPEVDISKVEKIAKRMGVGFRTRKYIVCFW